MDDNPLENGPATAKIREIAGSGTVAFSRHALERLGQRSLDENDVHNILRAGQVDRCDSGQHGDWVYKVVTPRRLWVAVVIRSDDSLLVVSAGR